jgi:AcrR family transcriptional regulator
MLLASERKILERNARRQRIFRAARNVVNDRTYAKTSIEQIAREASLSVGAIYLYFMSKEDLFVSTLLNELEETLERDRNAVYLWAKNEPLFPWLLFVLGEKGTYKQLSKETQANVERILLPFLNLTDIGHLVGNLILSRVFSCHNSIQTSQTS